MPTYSYECKKCGRVFDVFHSISATPKVRCEQCRGPVRRLMGAGAGLIFKGSGFYETDYKKSKGGAADTKAEGTSSESKAETKSEPKKSEGSSTKKD